MAAYLMIRIAVDEPAMLKPYQAVAPAIVAQYRGRFVVRGGASVTLEGPVESRRMVVIEFPELADAEAFYHSPEYTEARRLRDGVAVFECVAVEGVG